MAASVHVPSSRSEVASTSYFLKPIPLRARHPKATRSTRDRGLNERRLSSPVVPVQFNHESEKLPKHKPFHSSGLISPVYRLNLGKGDLLISFSIFSCRQICYGFGAYGFGFRGLARYQRLACKASRRNDASSRRKTTPVSGVMS